MKRTGAEIIVELLKRQGVRSVPGIPGGANLPLYDALCGSGIRHVLARHEQGAGFIAQGMARVTGRAAVCFGTSGPGATNLLTAIADAKLDSIPLVAITGQVPTAMLGTDAFQEVDTFGLTAPITKYNALVRSAAELLEEIPRAFAIAQSDRPGPVVIDIPKDVQNQTLDFARWPEPGQPGPRPASDEAAIRRLVAMIARAKRPILYIGGGIIASGCSEELRRLAGKNAIPVTSTLMGLGAYPSGDPLFLGMLGMHGARYTNYALEEADLLLAFGVRFDDRATGKAAEFCPRAAIAHIDIDPSEIGKIRPANHSIVADVGEAIRALLPLIENDERREWNGRIAGLKAEYPFEWPESDDPLHPLNLIGAVGRALPAEAVITTDVGQHQMWAAQAYPFRAPRTLLTSGGLGTMGFGLPAAIGAALALEEGREDENGGTRRRNGNSHSRPREMPPVACISGDGSLLMNIQELATLADLNLPVKTIILNNGHLGLVRQQQELFYAQRFHAVRFETNTDFAAIARAFGVPGVDLGKTADPGGALEEALAAPGPCLIDAPIHYAEKVFPMVPPGAANREMVDGAAYGMTAFSGSGTPPNAANTVLATSALSR